MGAVTQVCIGLAIAVLLVAAAFVLAWLKSPAWMKTPPAPGPARPASRAIAARKAWDGEGDDQYGPPRVVGVAQVIPAAEPECTCSPVTPPDLAAWVDREWEFADFNPDLIASLYVDPSEVTS